KNRSWLWLMEDSLAVHALVAQVLDLTTQFQQLKTDSAQQPTALNPPAVPPVDHTARYVEPRLPPPAVYSGEPQLCRSFLAKCSLHIALQPSSFPTEESKVAFVITLLYGRAALWGTAIWEQKHQCCSSFQSFSEELKKVFDRAVSGREVARVLAELHQGNRMVTDYSIEFRTLAAECKWHVEAQWDMFLHGLADRIHNEIYSQELPALLDELIDLAIQVDARLRRRDQRALRSPVVNMEDQFSAASTDTVGHTVDHEPMQVGRTRLSREEKERRRALGLCLYCGAAGQCSVPGKSQSPSVGRRLLTGGVAFEKSSSAATLLNYSTTQGVWNHAFFLCQALIDSGAEGNFLDFNFAHELGIPVNLLTHPVAVSALSSQSLPPVTHTTGPVSLITSGNHTEDIHFLLTDSPLASVVLGHPWLSLHNPNINWQQYTVSSWSEYCHASCLLSACSSVSCSVLQDEHADLSNVPVEYLDLKEVFSKSRAASLPPHRPYDCAIDLLSGTSPPKGRLYSLSPPEREAMEKYISDSLAAKIIRPSSSPAGAGFFFVEKKDGSLRPCIDYRGLNSITVKNTYPLPLMSSAFERLQGASFFTKLDNAYHLVRIREGDEWKTAFNTPRGHFEYLVMPFGLSNAPAVFQALVNDVLRDMIDQFIYVYLDDILIFSRSLQEHVQH
ncbi:hypothetical protein M9458_035254, partial [Cirrhinus mrigala]